MNLITGLRRAKQYGGTVERSAFNLNPNWPMRPIAVMRTGTCGYPSWPEIQLHKLARYIFADYSSTSFALAAMRRIIHVGSIIG
jgi:hypothetical protein